MENASVNVGKENATWILLLGLLTGGFSVILAGLVAGKKQNDIAEQLKWSIICMLLSGVFGIGYIMACCIACKTKKQSEG